jgi:hypothetical protein
VGKIAFQSKQKAMIQALASYKQIQSLIQTIVLSGANRDHLSFGQWRLSGESERSAMELGCSTKMFEELQ